MAGRKSGAGDQRNQPGQNKHRRPLHLPGLPTNSAALILDNATEIDIYALQRLMQCRRLFHHKLALILGARIEAPGAINDLVSRMIGTVIPSEEVQPKVELKSLKKNEVLSHVFRHLLVQHTDGFPAGMAKEGIQHIRESFWEKTGGNWHMIVNIERRMRDILRGDPDRTLTIERWESIIGKALEQPATVPA